MSTNNVIILACESSCDETAWCLYRPKDKTILANVLNTQTLKHKEYGGVVPENASREHLLHIDNLLQEALKQASITLGDITHFASTTTPGLPGSLLIGSAYTKALAWYYQKLFIPVNHLAGHIYSVFLEHEVPFPYICLSASGGHTALYVVKSFYEYTCIANTRDDAAGELFDKISKLLGLGYPGGALLEKYAQEVSFKDSKKYPRLKFNSLDFSFSGLKTAILYDTVDHGYYSMQTKQICKPIPLSYIQEVASSVMVAVGDIFINRLQQALELNPDVRGVAFVGGVACNRYLSTRIRNLTEKNGLHLYSPSACYCTDNAAMIACVASYYLSYHFPYTCDLAF